MFDFTLTAKEEKARIGTFSTPHGTVTTPMFMPVGTHGAVKGVSAQELGQVGSQVVLANTYHLHLRPGESVVEAAGGLHAFTGYQGPMLTDSGGFQVFSLGEKSMRGESRTPMRKITEEGITFTSHIDGSKHLLTPESAIEIEQKLGADIIMAFDQPVYGMSSPTEAGEAMQRTQRWLERSKEQWQRGRGDQALFGIVQGGIHQELHQQSAKFTVSQDLPGYAIGGLSVGESKEGMWRAVESICTLLPEDKPRYFMGLGDPYDVIDATLRGVDMYDCVSPSRLARHGAFWLAESTNESLLQAFYSGSTEKMLRGGTLKFSRRSIGSAPFRHDMNPLLGLQTELPWLPGELDVLPRASLCHYHRSNEMLASRVLTLHNVRMLHVITEHMRSAIAGGYLARLLRALDR